ncbi:MAG: hypothetical protein NC097_00910 [Clostridium sp.]|nr:hypothetical protein [Prevotella sp.]MCM1428340.1 hypothetical protein [Clostridium sp.]MCM1474812.1 hypothetical protein [Muribaculaceae bacterium]
MNKKILQMLLMAFIIAFALPSCIENKEDEPVQKPNVEHSTNYEPGDLFVFREFIYGGVSLNYQGHLSGIQSEVVVPHWITDSYRTVAVDLGSMFAKDSFSNLEDFTYEVGSEVLTLVPMLNDKLIEEGWEIVNTEFLYDGVSYGKRFDLPYGIDRNPSVIKVQFKYEVINNKNKHTVKDNLMLTVKVIRGTNN